MNLARENGYDGYIWLNWAPGAAASVWILLGALLAFSLGLLQNRAITSYLTAKQHLGHIVDNIELIASSYAGGSKITKTTSTLNVDGDTQNPDFQKYIFTQNPDFQKRLTKIKQFNEGILNLYAAWCTEMGYLTHEEYVQGFFILDGSDFTFAVSNQMLDLYSPRSGSTNDTVTLEDDNVTTPIAMYLHKFLRDSKDEKWIPQHLYDCCDAQLRDIQLTMNKCAYMRGSQADVGVCQILTWMICFQMVSMPFPLTGMMHWYAIPTACILTFVYTGFFYSALSLSSPFGVETEGWSIVGSLADHELKGSNTLSLLTRGVEIQQELHFMVRMLEYQETHRFHREGFQHNHPMKSRWKSTGRRSNTRRALTPATTHMQNQASLI